MLTLDRSGRREDAARRLTADAGQPSRITRDRKRVACVRFGLGAVAFELLSDAPLTFSDELQRYRAEPDSQPVVADVICSVLVDAAAFEGATAAGEARAERVAPIGEAGELHLRAKLAACSLRSVGPQRYACSARIADDPRALGALLTLIVMAVVQAEGGLVMHAAGIELDGRAILFVGPSRAGKSTAATLTAGATMFAHDRVVLTPDGRGGVLAHGMPGGTAAPMAQTGQAVWPLAGIFRVQQAPSGSRAWRVRGADALFLLRESVDIAEISIEAEQARLRAADAIASCEAVCTGVVHSVLGEPLAPALRAVLHANEAGA